MDMLKTVRKHVNMSLTFAAVLSQKTAFFKGVLLRKNFSNLTEKQKHRKTRKSPKPASGHARKSLLVRLKSHEGDDSTKLNLWIIEEMFVVNHEKLGRGSQPVDGDVPPLCHLQEEKLLRVKSSEEKTLPLTFSTANLWNSGPPTPKSTFSCSLVDHPTQSFCNMRFNFVNSIYLYYETEQDNLLPACGSKNCEGHARDCEGARWPGHLK